MGKKLLITALLFTFIISFAVARDTKRNDLGSEPTRITLTVGSIVLTATLNDCVASKDLISRLPYVVHLSRYAHDYCGVMSEPLEYNSLDEQNGWLDGDISFASNGNYFVLFFADGERSSQYGYQHILGKVDNLSALKALPDGAIEVRIELAE